MVVLGIHDVSYSLAGEAILDGVTLHVRPGDRITLVGRNGSGKSTLMRIAAGELSPDSGRVSVQREARLSVLPQTMPSGLAGTALEVATTAGPGEQPGAPDGANPQAVEDRRLAAEQFLTRLGVPPDTPVETASGGVRRRVLLARTLASGADVLLLDEPTNHLDIETMIWLEDYLLRLSRTEKRAILMVTHDRALARRFTTRVAELDRGALYDAETDWDSFVRRRRDELEAEAAQRREFDRKLAEEEAWLRKGVKARRARNEGRVRRLEAMREEHRQRRERQGTARMAIEEAGRSGKLVVETKGLRFAYGETPIVSELSTSIARGDRVGIVGPNGSGKTTLLRLLLGDLTPDAGQLRHGTNLEVVYFDQLREHIDLDASIYDNVGNGYDRVRQDGRERHLIGYLKDFLFTEEDMRKPARGVSGGEMNRMLLAKLFARPSNLLVLDEPTNDLDTETLELLEELLLDYEGTILLVSHDREFLDNVVSECLVLPGDGRVIEYSGGYSDWRAREEARRSGGSVPHEGAAARGAAGGEAGPGAGGDGGRRKPRTQKPRKLSYKQERELEALPERIAALEEEQTRLHERLADPELYRRDDGTTVQEHSSRLETVEAELAAAYARWEELELLREQGAG